MDWLPDWLNPYNYEPVLYFDANEFFRILENEPLAIMAVTFAFLNILLTVVFKFSDYWKELYREQSKRGRLHIELYPVMDEEKMQPALHVVLTNTGKEPIVLRELGYQRARWFSFLPTGIRQPFHRLEQHTLSLPLVLQAYEYAECRIQGESLNQLFHHQLAVRDSLGNIWQYPAQNRRWRRQLVRFHYEMESIPKEPSQVDSQTSTQPVSVLQLA